MKRFVPVVSLFLLAPLVGEFLLGNLPISMLFLLPFLALLYGSGALLIREVARRTGRGWPTIFVLALAYGVIEEGFATQSLFNPNYLGLRLLDDAHLPALGMGGFWTLYVLALHTVWSIAVPIALIETLARTRRRTPWLGPIGIAVTGLLFVIGVALTALSTIQTEHFIASPPQLIGAGIAIVVLIVIALILPKPREVKLSGPAAPNVWVVGLSALLASSLFMAMVTWAGVTPWVIVAGYLGVFVLVAALIASWSRRAGWSDAHRFALAAGATVTYAWHSFPQPPARGDLAVDLAGNAIFTAAALALLIVAALRIRREA
jgi:hypothetical protein